MTFNPFILKAKPVFNEKKQKFKTEFSEMYKKMYPEEGNKTRNATHFMDLDDSVEMELPNE